MNLNVDQQAVYDAVDRIWRRPHELARNAHLHPTRTQAVLVGLQRLGLVEHGDRDTWRRTEGGDGA